VTAYNITSGFGEAGGAASGDGGADDGFESAPHPLKTDHAIITKVEKMCIDFIVEYLN
jgi:hypothetical protein